MMYPDGTTTMSLIDRVAPYLSRLQGPVHAVATALLPQLFVNTPPADLQDRDPERLSKIVEAAAMLLIEKQPGDAEIRLLNASDPANGWLNGRSAIQIVHDDMPFLLDSIVSALHRHGYNILLIIHPILVLAPGLGGIAPATENRRESFIHIELWGAVPDRLTQVLIADLGNVLKDVDAAVTDWRAMTKLVTQASDELAAAHVDLPPDEITEATAFLDWLINDNFTFVGARHYDVTGGEFKVTGEGLGILRNPEIRVFGGLRASVQLSPVFLDVLRSPVPIIISQSDRRSTVHRDVPLDTVGIKQFNADGKVVGHTLLVGLFTSAAYEWPLRTIPILRGRLERVVARSGLPPDSHDGKALRHILGSLPRQELFQSNEDELYDHGMSVLYLQERDKVLLFIRHDPFGRFLSCFVYMPRAKYSAVLPEQMAAILQKAYVGTAKWSDVHVDEGTLARIHILLRVSPDEAVTPNQDAVEQKLAEITETFADRLLHALGQTGGQAASAGLASRYGNAFPIAYTERPGALDNAVADIPQAETIVNGLPILISIDLIGEERSGITLKVFHPNIPVVLSDILPILENFGLRVRNETPFEIKPTDSSLIVWLQEFELESRFTHWTPTVESAELFQEAFTGVWNGLFENDGFNRLVLLSGLTGREVIILRSYAKIWRQAGSQFSQAYIEDALSAHPEIARDLVRLFEAQFDPARDVGDALEERLTDRVIEALDQVAHLDEDRILRAFLQLIVHSLRTNFYQREGDGRPKSYLSIKLASEHIDLLPLPRPLYEIYVYSVRTEGVHLRGGRVARGGIRWSDRKEDFRTEILGLMKAQQVKNAVIVPLGSKGGFVVKQPPSNREALPAEVIACYRILISGMLDLTDNYRGREIVPPTNTIRRDADDPYLVVAADKGTATFSDIANALSHDYGFWLGDAFASGGSIGYDHKAMGITARGAWEAVKRHFRELGMDIQAQDFTCIGVGDMSGDVFGNGMLLSQHIRLRAAFDHRHIFIDPNPDALVSWHERNRLFQLPRSSWADYDRALLSTGGQIFERGLKSITLSPEAQTALGLGPQSFAPAELIQALLKSSVDLLWFGGIGTYVKASTESQADARDKVNDSLRVDARDLKARVLGEGANLGVTQRARIEYALKGGKINTDAIDNSAGVDTSDHEVNIKIGVDAMIEAGALPREDRPAFLAAMTEEVAALVLRDNYLQTLALSLEESSGEDGWERQQHLMTMLEHHAKLDRRLEFLPSDDVLQERHAAKIGLTRPELAVLLAYAKNLWKAELLAMPPAGTEAFDNDLLTYFPHQMREASQILTGHRLGREIIVTVIVNDAVNRLGPARLNELAARLRRTVLDVILAYREICRLFALSPLWAELEALDRDLKWPAQRDLFLSVLEMQENATEWLLTANVDLSNQKQLDQLRSRVDVLRQILNEVLPDQEKAFERRGFEALTSQGIAPGLLGLVEERRFLLRLLDMLDLNDVGDAAALLAFGSLYFAIGSRFGLSLLRDRAAHLTVATPWQRKARSEVLREIAGVQKALTRSIHRETPAGRGEDRLDSWINPRREQIQPIDETLQDIIRLPVVDYAALIVAINQLRRLLAA